MGYGTRLGQRLVHHNLLHQLDNDLSGILLALLGEHYRHSRRYGFPDHRPANDHIKFESREPEHRDWFLVFWHQVRYHQHHLHALPDIGDWLPLCGGGDTPYRQREASQSARRGRFHRGPSHR